MGSYRAPPELVREANERLARPVQDAIENGDYLEWAKAEAFRNLNQKRKNASQSTFKSMSGLHAEVEDISSEIVHVRLLSSTNRLVHSCNLQRDLFHDRHRDWDAPDDTSAFERHSQLRAREPRIITTPHYASAHETVVPFRQPRPTQEFQRRAAPGPRLRPQDYYAPTEAVYRDDTPVTDAIMAMDGFLQDVYGAAGRGVLKLGGATARAAWQNPKEAAAIAVGLAGAAAIMNALPDSALSATDTTSVSLVPESAAEPAPSRVQPINPEAPIQITWHGLTEAETDHLGITQEINGITDKGLRQTILDYMDHRHFRDALHMDNQTVIQQRTWVIEAAYGAQRFADRYPDKMRRAGYDNASEAFEGLVRFAQIESNFGRDLTNQRNNKVFGLWHAEDRTWAQLMFRYFEARDLRIDRGDFREMERAFDKGGIDAIRGMAGYQYLMQLRGDPEVGSMAMLHLQHENAYNLVNSTNGRISYEDFRNNPGLHYVTHVLGAGQARHVMLMAEEHPHQRPRLNTEVMQDNQGIFYDMMLRPRNATQVINEFQRRFTSADTRTERTTGGWSVNANALG